MHERPSPTPSFTLPSSWHLLLESELVKPYMLELSSFIQKERTEYKKIFPTEELVFNALQETPYEKVKVVIMGQDPYHGKGQAHGLSFSVPKNTPLPPSLQNIYKELRSDVKIPNPTSGCLLPWAKQGVLLLNATLTVREGQPLSHHKRGWERFTDAIITLLAERKEPVIFVLWGKNAQEKCAHILQKSQRHHILRAPHPSPFSAHTGFFNCRHFSMVNEILKKGGFEEINWEINE